VARGGRDGDESAAILQDRAEELARVVVVVDDEDVDTEQGVRREMVTPAHGKWRS
jgi:hypothetical protein